MPALSIYAIVLLGYLAGRIGMFSEADFRALGKFVVNLAVPALLFTAISQRSIVEIAQASFLVPYTAGSLAVFAGGAAYAKYVQRKSRPLAALVGLGMSSSNSALIAYPIAQQVIGPAAAVALAMCTLVENLLMQPAMLALAEGGDANGGGRRGLVMQTLTRLASNPFIIAIAAGSLVSWFKVELPEPVQRVIVPISSTTSALSLFVIGGTLVGLRPPGMFGDVMRIAFGKLILHPLAIVLVASMTPPMPRDLYTAAVIFASVPMLSIYPIWGQRFGEERFCAGVLLGTTLLSFPTVTAILWMMG